VTPLWRAQQNYELLLASHHQWLGQVRDPLPNEAREAEWEPVDPFAMMTAERQELIGLIETAFAGVDRQDGVSIRETRVIDCYGSDAERQEARSLDDEACWQAVPQDDLETFTSALSFCDAKAFRYYALAFMMWDLRALRRPGTPTPSRLPWHLQHNGNAGLLSALQSRAACRYLRFLAGYADSSKGTEAEQALKACWNRFSHWPTDH